MEPQSNSFLFVLDGSDQDHTAVEAGLQVCLKAVCLKGPREGLLEPAGVVYQNTVALR